MNTVYCNKKSTHQSVSFQFPYFITFGQESLPHQCNQGNRRIHSLTGVMFYPVVQHESWLCKWLNSNAELLTCSEINYQKQSACSHVSRGAGVTSISHSHSTTANSTAWTTYSLLHTNCPGVMQSRFWILKKKNKQTTTTKTWKSFFFITIWPLWPRMRLLCVLGLFVALLHLSTSLLLGAFNIKTFGDKKSSNTTLMNIISTVWKLQFIFPIPFLKRCSYTHFCISFVSDWNICKLQIIKI